MISVCLLKPFFLFQGMNFIAGYLILITKNEEESFWLLDALIGRILPGMLKTHIVVYWSFAFILSLLSSQFLEVLDVKMDLHGLKIF